MSESRDQKVIVGLIVASGLCVTVLVTMLVFARARTAPIVAGPGTPTTTASALPAGGIQPIVPVADPAAASASTQPAMQIPPVLYPAPAFTLTQRDGSTVSLKDLQGNIVIADFIFTRCGTICPRMSQQMAALQAKLVDKPYWDKIKLVSFTVDPDYDTPDVLTDYAKRFEADKTHWLFLTGKRKEMWALVAGGFKLPVADNTEESLMPILHSEKFVLIDGDGKIRGYYDALLAEPFSRLQSDIALLAAVK